MVQVFSARDGSDEAKYRSWFKKNPEGFILQCNRNLNRSYLVLHRSSCPSVTVEYSTQEKFTGHRYIKVCSNNEADLKHWLVIKGFNQFSKYCARCKPPQSPWPTTAQLLPKDLLRKRKLVLRRVRTRQGAPAFRSKLMDAYSGRCAATGCTAKEVLEAAHILPYAQDGANTANNGLLLRADIHTLFDLGLIAVDTNRKWIVSKSILDTEYEDLANKKLGEPAEAVERADQLALDWHRIYVFRR